MPWDGRSDDHVSSEAGELMAQLERGEVHVYVDVLDEPVAAAAATRGGPSAPGPQRRRGFGSRVAAAYLGVAPASVRVDRGSGRPVLLDAPHLGFSLADSGRLFAAAIGRGAVGVDVEDGCLPRRPERVAPRVLSPREHAERAQGADPHGTGSLLRCWTRKEAVLKAMGQGLAIDPSGVDVGAGATPRDPPSVRGRPAGLRLWDLPLEAPHAGAVAVDRETTVRWCTLP